MSAPDELYLDAVLVPCVRADIFPMGTWVQSCISSDATYVGGFLVADCLDVSGNSFTSSVQASATDSVSNQDGILHNDSSQTAGERVGADADGTASAALPAGSWSRTCEAKAYVGGILIAECLDRKGGIRKSSVAAAPSDAVANSDGLLVDTTTGVSGTKQSSGPGENCLCHNYLTLLLSSVDKAAHAMASNHVHGLS